MVGSQPFFRVIQDFLSDSMAHRGLSVGFLLLWYSVYVLLSPYLCFISFLYLDVHAFRDDALIS